MAKVLKAKVSLKTSFKRKNRSLDLRQQPLPCQTRQCKMKIRTCIRGTAESRINICTWVFLLCIASFGARNLSPLISKLWAKGINGENVSCRPGRQERKVAITLPRALVNTSLTDEKRRKTLTKVFQLLRIEFAGALLLHHGKAKGGDSVKEAKCLHNKLFVIDQKV